MQISLVVPTGTREEIVHASLSSLALLPKFKTLTLKKNMCLSFNGLDDNKKKLREFAKWILSISNGEISDLTFLNDCDASLVKIPSDLLLNVGLDLITIIVSPIYPCIGETNIDTNYFLKKGNHHSEKCYSYLDKQFFPS
jgi:hypothetical protein